MEYIGSAIAGILVSLVLGWLLRAPRPCASRRGEAFWIEYGWTFKTFAIFFLVIVFGLIALSFFVSEEDRRYVWYMVLLFGFVTTPLFLEFFFVRISFNNDGIKTFSPWRKSRDIPWVNVVEASFSKAAKWWVIKTRGMGFVRAHIYLSGLEGFLIELESRQLVSAQQIAAAKAATYRPRG